MKKEVSNKKAIITILVVIILLVVLAGMYVYLFKNNKNKNPEKKKYSDEIKTVATLLVVIILLVVLAGMYVYLFKNNKNKNPEKKKYSDEIKTVATLEDEITTNSIWCGTFQLVWNDMVNNVVKQDVVFTPQEKLVENLNKQTFKEDQLSEKDYYKVYDLLTLDLKEKIEKAIKEKFNEKSDILDSIDWSEAPKDASRIF